MNDQFKATVVAGSQHPEKSKPLFTMVLEYPRFIHAEFMTHRHFSRNAMSSRAVPVSKVIDQVRTNPAMPIHWGVNRPGMQAREELTGDDLAAVKWGWLRAAENAAEVADQMMELGAHKQVANRILEPFQIMKTIVTATEWSNFFELRRHEDADPNIHHLADLMFEAQAEYPLQTLNYGEWHLPFISADERATLDLETLKQISVARCARVSYLTHEGTVPVVEKDVALYRLLVGARPLHASPAEHQATPDKPFCSGWDKEHQHGNLVGWVQHRKLIEEDLWNAS
jgi:thymidylate synthase ThyX